MDKIICSECGAENEKELEFCKNCGAKLSKSEIPQGQAYPYNKQPEAQEYNSFNSGSVDGVPIEQLALFTGKKAAYYCPKFCEMSALQKKNSWNWSPAVLGLLFGPMGVALWCFYRKMYKWATLLIMIGVVLTAVSSALTYDVITQTVDLIRSISSASSADAISEIAEFVPKETVKSVIADRIDSICRLLSGILFGMFANYLYMKHCISSIKKYRQSGLDQRYYKLGLASLGGTSGGMLALGIIIMISVENLATITTMMIHLLA